MATSDRIPSLDGLRAMCIVVVVVGHLESTLSLGLPENVSLLFHIGKLAVRTFLAISGFLITAPLLEELARTRTVNLRRYYIRRTLRVFPAYYAFLAVMLVIRASGWTTTPYRDFAVAATYTTDYVRHSWWFGHTWSLSVQEQFYLCWPLLLILFGRRALWCAAALLVIAPISRTLPVPWPSLPDTRLDAYADSLAVGCLLAAWRPRLLAWPALSRFMASWRGFVLPLAMAVCIQWSVPHPRVVPGWVVTLLLFSVQNVMIVLMLHWGMMNRDLAIGRFLNSRPMLYLGAISYSIYIWQQPFLNRYFHTPLTTVPWNLLALTACVLASYYLIEKPSFALRRIVEARVAGSRRVSGLEPLKTTPADA